MNCKRRRLFSCINFYNLDIIFISFIFNSFSIFLCRIESSFSFKIIWSVSYPNEDSLISIKKHNIIIKHIILIKVVNLLNIKISLRIRAMEESRFKINRDSGFLYRTILCSSTYSIPKLIRLLTFFDFHFNICILSKLFH